MKTRKQITIVLTLFLFSTMYGFAQENSVDTASLLQKTWAITPNPPGASAYYEYTEKELTYRITYNDLFFSNTCKYYLSNTIDKVFDKSKVGKGLQGRYIIKESRLGDGRVIATEILMISEKRLITRGVTRVRENGETWRPEPIEYISE